MDIEFRGGRSILTVSGEIDLSNVGELRQSIDQVLAQAPECFEIDLSDVTYMDSAGIAALLSAYQRVHPPGRLVLVSANECLRNLFALIHLERLPGLYILDDIASAEQFLTAPR